MLKTRKSFVARPPHEEKTTRVLENTFIDNNPISVPVDIPVGDYNSQVYNPEIVNADSVLSSGQFISGNNAPVIVDPADIEYLSAPGVDVLLDGIDLES